MPFQYLSQRNPKWKDKKLGASDLTIGEFGCTTVSLSMALISFGYNVYPDQIAARKENYTKEGLILWNNLLLPGGFKFKWRYGSPTNFVRNDAEITRSLKNPNEFVLLSVGNNTHWVTGMGKILLSSNYRVADPWKGVQAKAPQDFRNISGSAHFYRP